ncbi:MULTISPECIES: Na+/H+ antiporter NhaA [unclassified Oceanobacter]|jgi:NhaA family Na+:H+ antiporter|uniref:Na+/H+ antiporter NhaA n=1 Tax=unclassified Oceanobacter TaxID=2620260 RepID=UPI0027353988|nr:MULTISPECIES: Na+/H+ antiporter NhaA [unclassified Oceanobacter]MDP2608717.1 Na+/H+ antiporter NhaA [Oceanobacter sp. 1_MG-2023]MDP2611813.1 Na+/H+ antiporter NhaA [Oceanobacter sp. 2_MG-2023]
MNISSLLPKSLNSLNSFFKMESASGLLLMFAALMAIIFANTPLEPFYNLLLDTPVEVHIGALHIAKPLLLWINDGLMAIFFFMVGLELKYEWLEGELRDKRNVVLPGIGALGGMFVPAVIYIAFNHKNELDIQGWAIPAATDIAFALGILMLLGSRVPTSIKIFLTSLAIFDDIGAIIIIAVFYTDNISLTALSVIALCLPILFMVNRLQVASKSVYMLLGAIMWVSMLKSGVHATLSGIMLAMFVPMKLDRQPGYSPAHQLEKDLHPVVAFFILPVFAFANAGLNLTGIGMDQLLHPIPVGIAAGLFIGKQLGIFAFCWLAIKIGWTKLPSNVSWTTLYGTAALCGVGFTMSLFIGSLAFEDGGGIENTFDERLGILIGSIASGILGYMVLNKSLGKPAESEAQNKA